MFTSEEASTMMHMVNISGRGRYLDGYEIRRCPICGSICDLWAVIKEPETGAKRDAYGYSLTEEQAVQVRCRSCGTMSGVLTRDSRINNQKLDPEKAIGPVMIRIWNSRILT